MYVVLWWALFGCPAQETQGELEIVVQVNDEVRTVLDVALNTPTETRARVHFGVDAAMSRVTPWTDAGTEHTLHLLGMPSDTEVSYQVELEDGTRSDRQTQSTGTLPAGLPKLTVSGIAEGLRDRYIVTGTGGSVFTVLILDGHGQIVWYRELDRTAPRSRLLRNGQLMIAASGPEHDGPGSLMAVSLAGGVLEPLDTPHVHHDFIEHGDGTLAAIFANEVEASGKADGVLEVAPDRTVTEIWDAWDYWGSPEAAGADTGLLDWTHANAIAYDESSDQYLLSLRSLGSIIAIERGTGEIAWSAFGSTSDLEVVEGYDTTDHHGMQLLDDGNLLLFDNGSFDGRGYSRVAEYDLDPDAGTIHETWSYTRDPPVECYVLGDVLRLDTGETLIVWSTAGELQLLDADDEPTWTVRADLGFIFTYASVVESLYPMEEE